MLPTYPLINQAKEARLPHENIVAQEKNTSAYSRIYVVASHIDLLYWYGNLTVRRAHEIVIPGAPVKLYFDLDHERRSIEDDDAFTKRVRNVMDKVGELFPTSPAPVVFEATRADKFSLHVIYPRIVFPSLEEMCFFLKSQSAFNDEKIVDKTVYSHGSFRMPYSEGFEKPVPLLPAGGVGQYDREMVKLGMLQYFDFPLSYLPKKRKVKTGRGGSSLLMSVSAGPAKKTTSDENERENHSHDATYKECLLEWASVHNYKITQYKQEDEYVSMLVRGVECLHAKRIHDKNNINVFIKLTEPQFPSFFTCMDKEDCPKAKWRGPLFSTILKPESITSRLQVLLNEFQGPLP